MKFTVVLGALTTLLASVVANPIEKRQSVVPKGQAIFKCKTPGQIALTFDDGPAQYTVEALNTLKAAGMKATFFVNGENWSSIGLHQATLQRMLAEGHQIGSHTWSHPYLTKLTANEVKTQMKQLDNELLRLIGRRPTYMRPPYFDYNAATLAVMKELGFKVIIADIDPKDTRGRPTLSFNDFVAGLNAGGSIVLAHDVQRSTVRGWLPMVIAEINKRKLKTVTIGECLGDPTRNWYSSASW